MIHMTVNLIFTNSKLWLVRVRRFQLCNKIDIDYSSHSKWSYHILDDRLEKYIDSPLILLLQIVALLRLQLWMQFLFLCMDIRHLIQTPSETSQPIHCVLKDICFLRPYFLLQLSNLVLHRFPILNCIKIFTFPFDCLIIVVWRKI